MKRTLEIFIELRNEPTIISLEAYLHRINYMSDLVRINSSVIFNDGDEKEIKIPEFTDSISAADWYNQFRNETLSKMNRHNDSVRKKIFTPNVYIHLPKEFYIIEKYNVERS